MATIPIVAVVGATASGKSDLALALAERLGATRAGGEIVNTDAMQIYRDMDIGTAKLPPTERRGIPHHLLDRLSVREPTSVAQFQQWARAAIADCRSRQVVPILVGGSALYTRAILDDFEFPGTDPAIRDRWEAELKMHGSEALHRVLAEQDPTAASQILPGNGRRIVRALEVIELTGKPFRAQLPEFTYVDPDTIQIGLRVDPDVLDRRIAERVDRMWEAGWVGEVELLIGQGLREGKTANRALGYRQILSFLDGDITDVEAREQTVAATRRFARRQLTWYEKDPRVTWLDAADPDLVERAVGVVEGT